MELEKKLFDQIRKLTGEAIGKFDLLHQGDRVLVALSGGKDSFILLEMLHYFAKVAPIKFQVIAGTFDPMFPEFNCEKIAQYCREHHWEHHKVELPMEEIIKNHHLEKSPCSLCSRLRRGKLYGLANSLNCNKLALGQHLDDLIASFFMSVARGQGLRTMAPKIRPSNPQYPEIIRPLSIVPEELLQKYAKEKNFVKGGICRYEEVVNLGDRHYFRELSDTISQKIPNFRSNFIRSLGHVELEHLMIGKEKIQKKL